MKRNDTTFKEMVARIQSGELTRNQAAEAYSVNYGTLCVWLGRSGLNDTTKTTPGNRHSSPYRHGVAKDWPRLPPETVSALDAAAARVAAGESTLRKEVAANPEIKFNTLAVRARRERVKAEAPIDKGDEAYIAEILRSPARRARAAAILRAAGV